MKAFEPVLMLTSVELHKLLQARAGCMFFVAAFLTFMAIGGFPSFVEDMKVSARELRCIEVIQGLISDADHIS